MGGLLCGFLALPVSTRQGVNYQVTTHRVPLGVKGVQFLLRDAQYRRLTREITNGIALGEPQEAALMSWVKGHVQPLPEGWPVVDDHILNIITRGYGTLDQMADVFTTLSTYAGHPAFWRVVGLRHNPSGILLCFVRLDGRWTVWDVGFGKPFRNAKGMLTDVFELIQDPRLATLTVGGATYHGWSYSQYIEEGMAPFEVPQMLRAEEQMPGKRILFEMRRARRSLFGGGFA